MGTVEVESPCSVDDRADAVDMLFFRSVSLTCRHQLECPCPKIRFQLQLQLQLPFHFPDQMSYFSIDSSQHNMFDHLSDPFALTILAKASLTSRSLYDSHTSYKATISCAAFTKSSKSTVDLAKYLMTL